jgi:hypothetical protein
MASLVKTQVTKHQRGFFGRIWQITFWLFQAFMIWTIFINADAISSQMATDCAAMTEESQRTACEAGTVIGGGIVAVGGWFVWFIGTVILGILMFATRGKLVTYDVKN